MAELSSQDGRQQDASPIWNWVSRAGVRRREARFGLPFDAPNGLPIRADFQRKAKPP
jgi:hypothetical protein